MSEEIANNKNNVILELDNGDIVEWQYKEIDCKYYGVMVGMEYLNPHSASLIETGEVIKTIELGDTKEEARYYWNKWIRQLKSLDGMVWEDGRIKKSS